MGWSVKGRAGVTKGKGLRERDTLTNDTGEGKPYRCDGGVREGEAGGGRQGKGREGKAR